MSRFGLFEGEGPGILEILQLLFLLPFSLISWIFYYIYRELKKLIFGGPRFSESLLYKFRVDPLELNELKAVLLHNGYKDVQIIDNVDSNKNDSSSFQKTFVIFVIYLSKSINDRQLDDIINEFMKQKGHLLEKAKTFHSIQDGFYNNWIDIACELKVYK